MERERENDGEKSRHRHPYRSLRAVHHYWSFRCERFFVCKELCGFEQREPVRGQWSSCEPLSDSSQISTREEKRTSCRADNEGLVAGLPVLLIGYSATLTKQRDSLQVNLTSFFVLNTFMICYYYSTGCFEALGIQSGEFDDGEIAASSMLKNFSSTDAWCPPKVDENQYLQVDLSRKTEITKLATQGEIGSKDRHVKTYALLYSDDGKKWKQYESHGKEKVKLLHVLISFILSIS